MRARRRIERARGGGYRVRLDPDERALLRALPGQLRDLLHASPDDPSLQRLFPPAYALENVQTMEFEGEYRRLMGPDLLDRRVQALAAFEETIDAEHLSEDQLTAWMTTLNDVRLVLGTRLDVSEDLDPTEVVPDDPRAPGLALYGYLSWLLEQIVEALAGGA